MRVRSYLRGCHLFTWVVFCGLMELLSFSSQLSRNLVSRSYICPIAESECSSPLYSSPFRAFLVNGGGGGGTVRRLLLLMQSPSEGVDDDHVAFPFFGVGRGGFFVLCPLWFVLFPSLLRAVLCTRGWPDVISRTRGNSGIVGLTKRCFGQSGMTDGGGLRVGAESFMSRLTTERARGCSF